jgi:hypothetical protein
MGHGDEAGFNCAGVARDCLTSLPTYPYGKETRVSRYPVLIGPSSLRVNRFK